MHARRVVAALLAAACMAGGLAQAAQGDLAELVDKLVRQGDETPQAAIDSISELASQEAASSPAIGRTMTTSIGIVAARNGMNAEALEQVAALVALGDRLAEADTHLGRAEIAVNAGHGEAAYRQARAALATYDDLCAPTSSRHAGLAPKHQ